MDIGSLFRNFSGQQRPAAPAPGAAPAAPAPPPGAPGSSLQASPAADPNKPNSPLDPFKDMWKTAPVDPKAPPADPFSVPMFQTDPTKIQEAAGQVDFLGQIPPEMLQKAMAGNDPQAFLAVINAVGQKSLATALHLSTMTTEQAGQKIGQRFNTALPGRFKDLQVNAQQPTNPALSHPAAQPILEMARNQIKMMNPDFSPEQIQKEAESYLMGLTQAMTSNDPAMVQQQQANKHAETNWDSWAGS